MHDLLLVTLVNHKARRRQSSKPARDLLSAAVSMPPGLYEAALKQAALHHDHNFSRYVRTLIARDLGTARTLS